MKYLKAICRRVNSIIHCVFVKLQYPRRFFFKGHTLISPSVHFAIKDNGKIYIGKRVGVRRNSELSVSENGNLIIGNDCFLNSGVHIACHDNITIGNGCRFGPGVKIFDHDYDYSDFQSGKHKTSPIKIGQNVWLGANVIILRGTEIGDGCVVAAGSILKGVFPENTIIVQKKETEIRNY